MIDLIIGVAQIALALGSPAGPAADRAWRPSVVRIRMVCDQDCNCHRTRYHERRPMPAGRDDLACRTPSGRYIGQYNGHYRKGPATGVGFDDKAPVREFPFPF
ncbi:hypothetical protein [Bradyrhizobium uaiense]|uniref:Uncharacterized protein n=1 Tax=Bradyrhizobium uaiense TaxID=2594946 RepID=A0A6P1BG78_9BRAD|nr:hypothetical protein [Bradyrhizobium uaiense]NEU97263.1 hypothetical protein [Bradyrhizobium uaiense]